MYVEQLVLLLTCQNTTCSMAKVLC
uniref:Uncharacterized protein n=1 Tax=Arundo donax TaxID=35708 RepID=A0A0A9ANB2_ARUDO